MSKDAKDTIGSARHVPVQDAGSINRAVEKAGRDPDFIGHAVAQLGGLLFPAFKQSIVNHARSANADPDVIALFESLNGYLEFRDLHHVQKAVEENSPEKRRKDPITDKTRENPDVRTRPTTADASIKAREAVSEKEERKDYPEVTPTAMSDFVCGRCGKPFQNQHDLVQHKRFESGTTTT